ncbi:MAG: hypothetical protein WA790_20005, partial [Sulfitobacter sp.]
MHLRRAEHEWPVRAIAAVRRTAPELTEGGQRGFMHVRLLLTQHLLARAAQEFQRCSNFHQT